jgi:GH24 family phage-related lysozyme (muramidase)
MEPSKACYDLIKDFEKCRLKAYLDPVGVPTIGWGHTSPSVRLGDEITQAQADAYLMNDVREVVKQINPLITHPLTQGQFDACVDFAYNLGWPRFKRSTMLTLINGGNLTTAAEEFVRWNRAAGRILAGLTRRRNAERAMFLGETNEST